MGPEYDYKKIYNNDRYKENDNEIQQYMFDQVQSENDVQFKGTMIYLGKCIARVR